MKSKLDKNKIIIFGLIFTIIGLIMCGIYFYVQYINQKKESTTKYELLDIDGELVHNLFDLTRNSDSTTLFYGTNYENIYYKNNELAIDQVDEMFKFVLSYIKLDNALVNFTDEKVYFKGEDLKSQYIKIFGDDDNYQHQNIIYGCPHEISYIAETDTYEYSEACGYFTERGYRQQITSARKYSDHIEIDEKVIFYTLNDEMEINEYYKDANYQEQLEVSQDDWTQIEGLQEYQYKFSELSEGTYYFSGVKRIK